MPKFKCTVAYDGTYFSGYQVQPDKRTVQREIEAALTRMHKGEEIRIIASGRTDAGVHARAQVFHFESSLNIPPQNWCRALNTLLPDDINITRVEHVHDTFHARFNVKKKVYRYRILNSDRRDMFRRLYTYYLSAPLDIKKMKAACPYFEGTHDFTSFCASNTSVVDKVRTIYKLDISPDHDELIIQVAGSGFLYQMVRIMTGALIDVGAGKIKPEEIEQILSKKDRRLAPKTAPAHGLTMWQVVY
ncbi:tRNA pseudouridine38-40 synthase [Scopulibacillus darangshiensis]|uniref:tRNA pseudouridine synthase A n=1 Tax=Scopulibacillus darangshiensis TaxID=442528 RepID=A0A4R2NRX5_9BACL|nr:tRNA pseudouridine(38-40) synthase TruA [Scopulibacillus darangshiensis]TCP24194.1 tRNA pseudouridine38-40 synthase [Scopulibacillus darangshiensis]